MALTTGTGGRASLKMLSGAGRSLLCACGDTQLQRYGASLTNDADAEEGLWATLTAASGPHSAWAHCRHDVCVVRHGVIPERQRVRPAHGVAQARTGHRRGLRAGQLRRRSSGDARVLGGGHQLRDGTANGGLKSTPIHGNPFSSYNGHRRAHWCTLKYHTYIATA